MQEVSGMTLSEWQQRLREVQDSIKSHEDSRRKASSIIRELKRTQDELLRGHQLGAMISASSGSKESEAPAKRDTLTSSRGDDSDSDLTRCESCAELSRWWGNKVWCARCLLPLPQDSNEI